MLTPALFSSRKATTSLSPYQQHCIKGVKPSYRREVRRCGGEGDGKGGKDGRRMEGEGEEWRGEGRVRGRRELLRDYTAANSSVSSNALYC